MAKQSIRIIQENRQCRFINKTLLVFFVVLFLLILATLSKDITYAQSSQPSQTKLLKETTLKNNPNEQYFLPGFPVSIWHTGGSFNSGAFMGPVITNDLSYGQKDILLSSLAVGPLNGFDFRGNILQGFPINFSAGAGYPASLKGYTAVAWNGNCSPVCQSYVNLYDASGTRLWSKQTLGIGVDVPPVIFESNDNLYVLYENSQHIYLVDIKGNTQVGWPILLSYDSPSHFAVSDITGDGQVEIIIDGISQNSESRTFVVSIEGQIIAESIELGVQNRSYSVIGDVNGDNKKDIIRLGKINSYPFDTEIQILDANAQIQRRFSVNDSTYYGTQVALGDFDMDGTPEIAFSTRTKIHVVDWMGNYMPGWPKSLNSSSVYGASAVVVGDILSDGGKPEVAYTESRIASNGTIIIRKHDGSLVESWDSNQIYPLGLSTSRTPAIADINGDGFNELVIAGNYWLGISGYYPAIWAISLDQNKRVPAHGTIYWGQYGSNSGRTSEYKPINMHVEEQK